MPDFERAVTEWFVAAGGVARTMVRIFADALGLPAGYFEPFTDHSLDVLRMNNYGLPDEDTALEPDQLGMGAHTDYGVVTVLWAEHLAAKLAGSRNGRLNPNATREATRVRGARAHA